jgi:alpha-glucosidase
VDELEAALPEGAWGNYVLGSHDVSRLATRFGEHTVRVAAMMLLTLRGTPTIYMGEELGMIDGNISTDQIQDPQGLRLGADRSRDVCRTPFQWSDEQYAGFSRVVPWLPVAEGHATCNVKTQFDDPHSVMRLYCQLIQLRKNTPALNRGHYQPLDNTSEHCFVYQREYQEQKYLVILNFSDVIQNPRFQSEQKTGELVLSTELDRKGTVNLESIQLRPNEGVIVKLMK